MGISVGLRKTMLHSMGVQSRQIATYHENANLCRDQSRVKTNNRDSH
jgi:hypothetical protein